MNNRALINTKNFMLQDKIGTGSFFDAYKIVDKSSGRILAANISNGHIHGDDIRLKKMVSIISKINHPCIVKFIGYSPTFNNNYRKPTIITEFIQNGSLDDMINREMKGIAHSE